MPLHLVLLSLLLLATVSAFAGDGTLIDLDHVTTDKVTWVTQGEPRVGIPKLSDYAPGTFIDVVVNVETGQVAMGFAWDTTGKRVIPKYSPTAGEKANQPLEDSLRFDSNGGHEAIAKKAGLWKEGVNPGNLAGGGILINADGTYTLTIRSQGINGGVATQAWNDPREVPLGRVPLFGDAVAKLFDVPVKWNSKVTTRRFEPSSALGFTDAVKALGLKVKKGSLLQDSRDLEDKVVEFKPPSPPEETPTRTSTPSCIAGKISG